MYAPHVGSSRDDTQGEAADNGFSVVLLRVPKGEIDSIHPLNLAVPDIEPQPREIL